MSQNRIQHPHNPPDRNMMGGVPYNAVRVNKEMASTIEKLEDECGRLPDLYFRKFRLLEKLQMERPQYPFATNVRLSTNKPVFIQHNLWDKVLKEVYWRAADFKEEKKAKLAQAFHLSKKMKRHMSKKFLVRDELHFYHKLLCIQLSKDLDDTFSSIKGLKDDNQISHEYIPPHELQDIRKREKEERERKEQEEAERRTQLEQEQLDDQYVDQFFGDDDMGEPQQEAAKSPSHAPPPAPQPAQEAELNQENNNSSSNNNNNSARIPEQQGDFKKLKPIARFLKRMIEINPDSFETPEIKAYQEYRDFERKKDILDKLKDTIIKYGGKRKERPSIDNIFNSIYPQQQLQQNQSLQQQQEQQNLLDKQIQLSSAFEESQLQDIKEEESQQQQQQQQQKNQHVKQISQSNDDELKLISNNQSIVNNVPAKIQQDDSMKEEQDEINYLVSSDQKLNPQINFGSKKEESFFNNNNADTNYLNDFERNESQNIGQARGSGEDYFDVLNPDEPPLQHNEQSAQFISDIKEEDQVKEPVFRSEESEIKELKEGGSEIIFDENPQPNQQEQKQEDQNNQPQSGSSPAKAANENEQENQQKENKEEPQVESNIEGDVPLIVVEEKKEEAAGEQKQQEINQVKEEFQEQQQQNQQEGEPKIVDVEEEMNDVVKNEQGENKGDNSKKEEEQFQMEIEKDETKIENIDGEMDHPNSGQIKVIDDELNESSAQQQNNLSEFDKIKMQIKNTLHHQLQVYDQSVCSIMQVEVSKKRKKKDDNQKDTLNEEFLNHIKSLNPQIDPKKMKYENLNELLMFNYNKNQLQQDYDKIFEKTINNYLDFPRDFSQIPRVQEVDEDEIEMKGQDLYDLPYETFCFTHGLDMDKFLKKCHQNLSLMVNQDKINSKNGGPQKDLVYIDELFKTYPIARKDNNLFAIYTQIDPKSQTCARVFNESFISGNDKYRVVSLIAKQPIFFFFFEYYQGIWGNRHHLIANSLNSNPITKHYQFNNKIVEKLDWTLRIKKKEKFAYLSEAILPTMYMFKGDNVKVNEQFHHFVEEKKKKEELEYNNKSNLLNDEFDFEEAVNKREKTCTSSFLKPQQQIFKNMNKSFANYFSQNRLYDVSNKLEYRKSIIEYARQVKNTGSKYNFDNKEEDKGKTIDYSSFTKMIKVEDVKVLLKNASVAQNNLNPKPYSRKKVIIEQSNELYIILNNLKSQVPQNMNGPQAPPHGNIPPEMMPPQGGPYRGPPPHGHPMRQGGMPQMMSRQNSNMAHGPYPNYPPNNIPPNQQQHMNQQRPPHHGYNEPPNGPPNTQGPSGGPGNAPPPPHSGHHSQQGMQQGSNIPPQGMMHHRSGPPPHGMNPSSQGQERPQGNVPPGNQPPPHHHAQGPPPYSGQPSGNHMNHHHHHHSMQGHQPSTNSQQNTPGGQHPSMHNQPPPNHQQMSGPGGMHHPPGPNPSGQHMEKQMSMGGHPNGSMQNHPQPPPYHSGPPPHGHGYPQGNMPPPHSSQQIPPQGGPQGGQGGMGPPMKQMHGQHPNYPQQHQGMNNHMQQNMPPGPPPSGQMPNHPQSQQGPPPPPNNLQQQQSNHERMPINKKIKKSDTGSPKNPPKKQSMQTSAAATPAQADNTSDKGSPKKKKQTKKKKGQEDPNQASQSQLSMPNQ